MPRIVCKLSKGLLKNLRAPFLARASVSGLRSERDAKLSDTIYFKAPWPSRCKEGSSFEVLKFVSKNLKLIRKAPPLRVA